MHIKKVYVSIIILTVVLASCQTPPYIGGAESPVTIMSFNLRFDNWEDEENRWDNRKNSILTMMETYQPSVLGIQEGLAHQVNFLNDNLDLYESVGVGRDDGEFEGEFNSVFWLRDEFNLLESGTFWLSETPEIPSYGWDAACRRIVTWVHLSPVDKQRSFYMFNTHLDHEGAEARTKSIILLMQKIENISVDDTTVYVTGDFNTLYSAFALKPLRDEFYSAKHTSEVSDSKLSFNSFGSLFKLNIDFIFYKNANAVKYKTIDDDFGVPYISDHFPVIAEFLQIGVL